MIEMHSAHIYKGTHLLVIGGRSLEVGKPLAEIAFSDTIYAIELANGKVSIFGKLPCALGSHVSAMIDDKYLIVYGGTNGYRFFDSILRYDIDEKQWTLMTKQPGELVGSPFFSEGRIAVASDAFGKGFSVFFGGCSAENDCNDLMVVPFTHIRDSANFNEITEIM